MKTISIDTLKRADACTGQILLFERTFGESVEITHANCVKAEKAGLNLTLIAANLFSEHALTGYDKTIAFAWAIYEKIVGAMDVVYEQGKATAWTNYKKTQGTNRKTRAINWTSYQKDMILIQTAYDKTIMAAWVALAKARASAFYEAWVEDYGDRHEND